MRDDMTTISVTKGTVQKLRMAKHRVALVLRNSSVTNDDTVSFLIDYFNRCEDRERQMERTPEDIPDGDGVRA